jgi:hypothetical protein
MNTADAQRQESPRRKSHRAHGVRKEDLAAIKGFAAQPKPALTGKPVEVEVACRCSYLSYPQILRGDEKRKHDNGEPYDEFSQPGSRR